MGRYGAGNNAAAAPSGGSGLDKLMGGGGGGERRGPQSDPPPPNRRGPQSDPPPRGGGGGFGGGDRGGGYGGGGGGSRYGQGGGGDARGGGGGGDMGRYTSSRPSGMGRYGSGNRFGALQKDAGPGMQARKEDFPQALPSSTVVKKEEPQHVKEARLALEKVKLEKRRLTEVAHREAQEAALLQKKADKKAAEEAEKAAIAKALSSPAAAADAFAAARFIKFGADMSWLKAEAAGLIKVAPTTEDQAALLLATQRHLATLNFPKDANGKGLVQQAFKLLFLNEVCDVEAFEMWRDADDAVSEAVPGKIKALTQTTEFFSYLDTVDDSDDDDDDDEEEAEDEMAAAPVPI